MRQKRDTNSKDEKKERKRERQIERDPSRRKRHREGDNRTETKRKNGGKGDIIANIYKQTYCYCDRQKKNSEIKIYVEGDREKERQK